jgi:hypothetical protein
VVNNKVYWGIVDQTLQSLLKSKHTFQCVLWDDRAEFVDVNRIKHAIETKMGRGGTNPASIFNISKNYNNAHIILLTDGQISQSEVHLLEQKLQSVQYKFDFTGHVIGNANYSVLAPFMQYGNVEIYQNDSLVFRGNVKNFDYDREITLESIVNNFDKLVNKIQFNNMGRDNTVMKDYLVVKRREWLREQSERNGEDLNDLVKMCMFGTNTPNASTPLSFSRKHIFDLVNRREDFSLVEKIDKLISLCNMKGVYSVQAPSRLFNSNKTVNNELPQEVEIDANSNQFECPISLDEDAPVLLIKRALSYYLVNFDKTVANNILNCPLLITKQKPDLLFPYLDHPIGVNACKILFEDVNVGSILSPFTRESVAGCIPLGCDHQHVRVGDNTIFKIMNGGGMTGSPTLFLCGLYLSIKNNKEFQYLNSNASFMKTFENHIKFRLMNYKTVICVNSEEDFTQTRVPIILMLYFTVFSYDIYTRVNGHASVNERETFAMKYDRLKQFFYYIDAFIDLIKLCDNSLSDDNFKEVRIRCEQYRVLGRALDMIKNDEKEFNDVKRNLYQKCLMVKNERIFVDSQQNDENIAYTTFKSFLTVKQLFNVLNVVKIAKFGDINLPHYSDDSGEFDSLKREVKKMYDITDVDHFTILSKKTMRPLMKINGNPFEDECEKHNRIKHKFMPLYELFNVYTCTNREYPTFENFVAFVKRKMEQRLSDKCDVFPSNFESIFKDVIEKMLKLIDQCSLDEYIKISTLSRPREMREKMERETD